MSASIDIALAVPVTPAQLADAFSQMNDEEQAQFFIEAARIAGEWPSGGDLQWWLVGRHLRTCDCSTIAAVEMVTEIAAGARADP